MRVKFPARYKKLATSILRKAKRNNIAIRFVNADIVYQNEKDPAGSCGYCDDKEIVVAIDNDFDVWMPVFIHESCHMDQALDKKLTDKCIEWDKAYTGFYTWLEGGANYNKTQLKRMVKFIIECEKDCDQRAIAKIKKFKLPIDIKYYIQASNVYLFSHHLVMDTRTWYMKIYLDTNLISKAPSHYDNDYSKIPSALGKAFLKYVDEQEWEQLRQDIAA